MEDLALAIIGQDEGRSLLIYFGAVLFGFVLALLFDRGQSRLLRSEYYLVMAALFLIGSAAQFIWLGAFWAASHGFLWMMLSTDLTLAAVLGYATARAARARSRSAFGHAWWAPLGIVPIANLVLLFCPPANRDLPKERTARIEAWIVLGLILMGLTGRTDWFFERTMSDMTERVENETLGTTIRAMANELELPQRIDNVTTLVQVDADGSVLRFHYLVDSDLVTLPDVFAAGLKKEKCSHPAFASVIESGGAVEHAYARLDDGVSIGTVVLDRENCNAIGTNNS